MKKRKYKKPKIEVKKLQTYFFTCLRNAHEGCTSLTGADVLGSGCPVP